MRNDTGLDTYIPSPIIFSRINEYFSFVCESDEELVEVARHQSIKGTTDPLTFVYVRPLRHVHSLLGIDLFILSMIRNE